ncbi:large subunit ribosomal protein L10 [Fistulifera solaris]|jgi:large subunit ribosomal protein L10|uniref:Large subunit ribosomal protein L10 n=1 Tax=Fistulifera solaris TaxID=1519565 RepID=A0A1Z5K7S4_FISSO|nr:large subunit ribosomal protein L10 [Fistulifera solaris]|eukprot:GAX22330.1 large subunit ribosomal protein L10 [Fistulifera solaris]
MINRTLFILFIGSAAAFSNQPWGSSTRSSTLQPLFGGGSGVATSLEGKKSTVQTVKGLLQDSEMVFTIPASSITVAEMQKLRRSMPEGTTVKVVKNTLMERAVEGTDYEVATSLLTGANLWFFIEDDISATIKAYNGFLKDCGKKDTHPILGGVTEGISYDTKGVEAIGKLPSKQELYAKIAGSIKAVPTKVARVIKAPGNKLARAIKLAADEKSP